MSRSYSEGSQRNTFLHSWLLREIIIKAIAEYEKNKKIIPNRQGLKTNAGSLKSDEERNETSTNSYHDGKVPVFLKKKKKATIYIPHNKFSFRYQEARRILLPSPLTHTHTHTHTAPRKTRSASCTITDAANSWTLPQKIKPHKDSNRLSLSILGHPGLDQNHFQVMQ